MTTQHEVETRQAAGQHQEDNDAQNQPSTQRDIARIGHMDARFGDIDKRFSTVEDRLVQVEDRLVQMNGRISGLDTNIALLDAKVDAQREHFDIKIDGQSEKFDAKLEREMRRQTVRIGGVIMLMFTALIGVLEFF